MGARRVRGVSATFVCGALLCAAMGPFSVIHAQVTQDTSAQGNLNTSVTPGPNYDITGGTRSGENLFHSFSSFSVGAGEIANFQNAIVPATGLPVPTSNILSRVTGGARSDIYGTIQTTNFVGANLFLMNPAGILFGPGSQLNVAGSFHATTADYMKLGDGPGIFYADPARPTVLSAAAPSAFGFLRSNPASIDVQGGSFNFGTFEFSPLQVGSFAAPETYLNQTLSFVGGTVNLGAAEVRNAAGDIVEDAKPTFILAPDGRINVVSVASVGEAAFDSATHVINTDSVPTLGDVNIKGGYIFGGGLMFPSYIDGKYVSIAAGQLAIDNALIWPAFYSGFGLTPRANGGEINADIRGSMTITGTDVEPFLGNAPGIFTLTGTLGPPAGFPDAKGPDVVIRAGALTISGAASIQTARAGPGQASDVTVTADTLTVANGGSISLLNLYGGAGGTLTIDAREVNLSGDGTPSPTGNTGLAAQNFIHPCFGCAANYDPALTYADAGTIKVINADRVSITGDAAIVTDSAGLGRAGDIMISTGDLVIAGAGPFTAAITSQSAISGDAGNITIDATGNIELRGGGRIAGNTFGAGKGSNVFVKAGKSITLSDADSRITNATGPLPPEELDAVFESQLGISFTGLVEYFGLPADTTLFQLLAFLNDIGLFYIPSAEPGDAGTTTINAPVLTLNSGTRVEISTAWDSNAGTLTANVGSLFLNDGGTLNSRSGIQFLSGELVVGSGNAGAIKVYATDTISVSGAGSAVSTSTLGDGKAGDVLLDAGNQVAIVNGGRVVSESGGQVSGAVVAGSGAGGTVTITAGNAVSIAGQDAVVSTSSFGDGDGGDIALNAGSSVQIANGGLVSADSLALVGAGTGLAGDITITSGDSITLDNGTISTRAVTADGGNVNLFAPNLVYLNNSQITTSVESGFGGGGNIFIDPQFVILNNSAIIANAFGGPGGNITIIADNFLASATSIVEASSALSTPGVIQIVSPDNNVESSIQVLAAAFLDASSQLRGLCSARRTGAPSSFAVAGRGGVPVEADGYLPSFGTQAATGVAGGAGPVVADAGGGIGGQPMMLALVMPDSLNCAR